MITKIVKRDGRSADFNLDKITHAIYKAAVSYTHLDVYKRQELYDGLQRADHHPRYYALLYRTKKFYSGNCHHRQQIGVPC